MKQQDTAMNSREKVFSAMRDALETVDKDCMYMDEIHDSLDDLFPSAPESASSEVLSLFVSRAEENGIRIIRCLSSDEAVRWLEEFLKEKKSAVFARDTLLQGDGLATMMRVRFQDLRCLEVGDKDLSLEQEGKHVYAATQVGIGSAIAGIAEVGAVILAASPSESRCVSLLPEEHVAVLHEKDVRGTLAEYFSEAGDVLHTSTAVTVVGGPSKTADIEKVLVTGVHGPKAMTVLLLSDSTG